MKIRLFFNELVSPAGFQKHAVASSTTETYAPPKALPALPISISRKFIDVVPFLFTGAAERIEIIKHIIDIYILYIFLFNY